jgi:hypothetical protein
MNFNLKTAGTLLSRAKQVFNQSIPFHRKSVFFSCLQFTEEKLGQATERTEYDDSFEQLLTAADRSKSWTERLISHVETVLQPNPSEDIFLLHKD